MKPLFHKSLATLSLMVVLPLLSPSVFAQSCDPQIKQRAEQEMARRVQEEAARAQAIYGGHMEQPDWLAKSNGLLTACMKGNWASFLDKVPVIAGFSAKEMAVKKACDEARKTISQGTQSYQSILKTVQGYESMVDPYANSLSGWSQTGNIQIPPEVTNGVDWGDLGGIIPKGGITIPGVGTPTTPKPTNPKDPNPPGGLPGVTP